jgi:hypothetical protein
MEKTGFIPSLYPWPYGENKKQELLRFRNQFAMEHPGLELCVELHWRLFYYPILPSGETDRIVKENLSTIAFQGRYLPGAEPRARPAFPAHTRGHARLAPPQVAGRCARNRPPETL